MTITSSGLRCDVCGNYILLSDYEGFDATGIDGELHCHVPKCKQAIIDAGKDWTKLPAGPLRRAFEDAWAATEPKPQKQIPGVE